MKLIDQGKINFWRIYSDIRCKLFEYKNWRNKIRTISDMEVSINGVMLKLDDSKIKYQDGFTSFDKSKYNLVCNMGTQYKCGNITGKWEPKDVFWDKNTSLQFLVTPENGDVTAQQEWDGPYHYDFKAGWIDTRGKFNADKGWFHAKLKLAAGNEHWPAWWLLGDTTLNNESPIVPEFDIFELMNGKLSFSMHLDYSSEHLKHSTNSLKFDHTKWFVLSFHWTKDFCDWYLNGFLVKRFGLNISDYVAKPHWFIFNEGYRGDLNKLDPNDGMKLDWIIITDEDVDFGF